MKSAKNVPISKLTYDSSLQMRVALNEAAVESYAELLRESDHWPFSTPVELFDINDHLVLADGWHRVEAAKRANRTSVSAHVRTGSIADAFRFALSANGDHGLNRSIADKRKAVRSALMNDDYFDLSNRELAKLCAVSEAFVRKVKQDRKSALQNFESDIGQGLQTAITIAIELGELAWSTGDFDKIRNAFWSKFFPVGCPVTQATRNEQWALILEMSNPALEITRRESAKDKYVFSYLNLAAKA